MTIYLLDTNAISDLMVSQRQVMLRAAEHLAVGDTLGICRPVHYEILRGLYWREATGKLQIYTRRVVPLLSWVDLQDSDWDDACRVE